MMKALIFALFISFSSYAYIPTVESLFRHGSNPDVSTNGASFNLVVKKITLGEKKTAEINDAANLNGESKEEYYKVYFSRTTDGLKVAQTRSTNSHFSEASLLHKVYYPNFNAFTVKASSESAERGIFYGLLHSLAFNNGAHIVSYLKSLGVPVKLNNEIINREKIEFLADYKRYLISVKQERGLRKNHVNPLKPDDSAARERAHAIMGGSMYSDTKQVSLSKDEGQIAWVVSAGQFEAAFSHKERDVQRILYKSSAGDFEIICKDYWHATGTHSVPKFLLIKTFNGQQFQVEISNLRHYSEREEDLIKRLRNWDQILKGKESAEIRPEFLL
jgi:hypothetical protein